MRTPSRDRRRVIHSGRAKAFVQILCGLFRTGGDLFSLLSWFHVAGQASSAVGVRWYLTHLLGKARLDFGTMS
jgi:hypothetical protein